MRIVYFDIDTLRPDHLGAYGYHRATSPAIDELARRGARFESCYVSDAPCLPSRTALFSGRFGIHNGVVGHGGAAAHMRYPGDGHVTDPEALPLPMVLSRAGYKTATFTTFAQHHLAWHFYAGWDEIHKHSNKNSLEIARDVNEAVLPWLQQHATKDDFFLHINFWDPHTPYRTPMSFGDPFVDEPGPDWVTQELIDEHLLGYGEFSAPDYLDLSPGFPRLPSQLRNESDFKRWIDGYDTGIRYADTHIAQVMNALDSAGVLDDTAIIVSADHGENQGELNVYGDHPVADECTSHVPLVISWPGGVKDETVEGFVYQLDLAPTLCELLGLRTPRRWDGTSFAPAVRGEPFRGRDHVVLGQGARTCQRAVRTGSLLFIRTYHPGLGAYPREMLFDVEKDPHETTNLIEDRADEAGACDHLLAQWWHEAVSGVDAAPDPMLTVMHEGGPWYARLNQQTFALRLRATGRDWAADEIERRMARPTDPRYMGELSDTRVIRAVARSVSSSDSGR
jgi:arylsulfatase A-like enzyme